MKHTLKDKKLIISKYSLSIFPGRKSIPSPDFFNQKGYSLLEVLVVLAILGLLLAISLPQINILTINYRLTGATRLVWGDLQNAKMTAIKTNQSVTVTFNTLTSYSFPRGDGMNFTRDLSKEYPNVTALKNGGGTITFGSTGMTQNTTVTIQGSQGNKTITLLWTGRILIT
jgi:general secretion pathway protein H